jgi:DNA-binding beta-propeller fold protein YncE
LTALPAAAAPPQAPGLLPRFRGEILLNAEPGGVGFHSDERALYTQAGAPFLAELELASLGQRRLSRELVDPRGLARDSNGDVWIADAGRHCVVRFDAAGASLGTLGNWGSGPGQLNEPLGLALDARKLYVADARNDRVAMFDRQGEWTGALGAQGSGPGRLRRPVDVAVDEGGGVWVADADNHRVVCFGPDGQIRASAGGFGARPGQFASPMAVEVHGARVYVADRDNHRIQVLALDGSLLGEWGEHALRPREAGGKLHYPDGIALTSRGDLALVLESFENRAQLFGPEEKQAEQPIPFVLPRGAAPASHFGPALGCDGDWLALLEPALPALALYLLDVPGTRGEPLLFSRWSPSAGQAGRFVRPTDVVADSRAGRVVVADAGTRRIEIFSVEAPPRDGFRFDLRYVRLATSLDTSRIALPEDCHAVGPLSPDALASLPDGRLVVVDRTNRLVCLLSLAGELERAWTGGSERLIDPHEACASPDGRRIWVADRLAGRLLAFDPAREEPEPVERRECRSRRPMAVACAEQGVVFVTDQLGHGIERCASDGSAMWGSEHSGLGPAQFYKPRGLAWLAGAGAGEANLSRLAVLDWGNHRLQLLDSSGRFLLAFGDRLFAEPALGR